VRLSFSRGHAAYFGFGIGVPMLAAGSEFLCMRSARL